MPSALFSRLTTASLWTLQTYCSCMCEVLRYEIYSINQATRSLSFGRTEAISCHLLA